MNHLQIFFVVVCVFGVRQVEGQEPTPTGVRFVGVGYNIVDGNPEGGEGNNGGVDPGLLSTRQILSLTYNEARSTNGFLVPDEVTFSPRQSCVKESSHSTFFGTKSYQDSLSISVDVSGNFLKRFEFSNSFGYKRVKNAAEKEHKIYHQETEVCNLGRARYREGLASQFSTTDEFASASCELSSVYNQSQYMDFWTIGALTLLWKLTLDTKSYVEPNRAGVKLSRMRCAVSQITLVLALGFSDFLQV